MKEIQQYKAFIESVCKAYGIPDAIQPLQTGFATLMEATIGMDRIGMYDVDIDEDMLKNSMATDEYSCSHVDPESAQQIWNAFDRQFAAINGVDAAYQKALDDLAAQGVDISVFPEDNSEYIAAFGTSIDAPEQDQPWMCEECSLMESDTHRDQAKYDLKQYWHDEDNVGDIQTMKDSVSNYDWSQTGVKGMGLSGKFGNAYDLKNDGFGSLDSRNSGLAPVGRREMKRKENEFYNNDIQSQLDDMMTTDADGAIVDELKTALSDLYARWNEQNDANGVMTSDTDFRQYVDEALSELAIGG